MAELPPPPPLDPRTYQELVDQTIELAEAYTKDLTQGGQPVPGWAAEGDDIGSALIEVFANMMSQVVTRLNRVLENNHLAFLGLLGTEQQAPQPARVPLTFTLVSGSDVESAVPQGTSVSGGDPEAIFTTERDLYLTRAELQGVFVREPQWDRYADDTDIALGNEPPGSDDWYYVLSGGLQGVDESRFTPVDHSLYLSADALFAQPDTNEWRISFTLPSDPSAQTFFELLQNGEIEWQFSTDEGFEALWPLVSALAPKWEVAYSRTGSVCTMTVTAPPQLGTWTVGSVAAGWLRAQLLAPIVEAGDVPPPIDAIDASASMQQEDFVQPENAYYNGTAIDLTRDFFPFGQRPQLGDVFYVASEAVLDKPGARVSVSVVVSDNVKATPTDDLLLRWEVYTVDGWTKVDPKPLVDAGAPGVTADPTDGLAKTGIFELKLPDNVTLYEQFGVSSAWLRVRIISGSYGSEFVWDAEARQWIPANFQPPALQLFALNYEVVLDTPLPGDGSFAQSANDGTFADWVPGALPYVKVQEDYESLYFGFSRPFSNQQVTIFLETPPPLESDVTFDPSDNPSTPPSLQIEWSYSSIDTDGALVWKDLVVEDATQQLSHSDVMTFIGPPDVQPCQQFGRELCWIKARRVGAQFEQPRLLQRIIPNTVWASNLIETDDEVLGSSDGSQSQQFTLSQTPVLDGALLEVNEPSLTSDQVETLRKARPGSVQTVSPDPQSPPTEIWVTWIKVPDFYASGPNDRHYMLDHMSGVVTFGNGQSGMIPNIGTRNIRATYASGGGDKGNVDAGMITQLKTTVPFVSGVDNAVPASGGADQESVEAAKARGAASLRNGGRAVTQQDFIDLAMSASPLVARATAISPAFNAIDQYSLSGGAPVYGEGQVVVVVVPSTNVPQPVPGYALLSRVQQALAAVCPPAVTPQVFGPLWIRVEVLARVVPESDDLTNQITTAAQQRINAFLNPLTGNGGAGWDFGTLPYESMFYALLAEIPGVKYVVDESVELVLTPAPPSYSLIDQRRRQAMLIFSAGIHHIAVEPEGVT